MLVKSGNQASGNPEPHSQVELSDIVTVSRKGRKPKNGTAMSPADRKRQQRERKRKADTDTPRWLRFRREVWEFVQSRYMLSNADEVAHALLAVSTAIVVARRWQEHEPDDIKFYLSPLVALNDPSKAAEVVGRYFSDELLAYKPDGEFDAQFPGATSKLVYDLLRDIGSESRNGGAK